MRRRRWPAGRARWSRWRRRSRWPGARRSRMPCSRVSLPVRSAAVVVSEADKLLPLVAEDARPTVLDGLIRIAAEEGPRECRKLRPELLAKYGVDGQLQREQDATKRFVSLSQPFVDEMGVAEYRLTLDPEGKAVLEAALGPLSAPAPVEGERDLRSSDRRRGDALVTLVRRAVATADQGPRHTKSQLFVTVDLETLQSGLRGAGVIVGGPEAGTLLAPETVRRLACDATIVPTVLGVTGAVVDLGRDVRLFTSAQIKRLWLRDGHCTYPGCRHAWPMGGRAPLGALGGWRADRPVERGAAVRAAPHGGPHPEVRGSTRRGRHRQPGRVGSHGRLVRPAPRDPSGTRTSVTPPRTLPAPAGCTATPSWERGPQPPVAALVLRVALTACTSSGQGEVSTTTRLGDRDA